MLHSPYPKGDAHHALAMPVYQTVAYEFDTAEAMEEAFCGRTSDHAYSRITNPTVEYFEQRIRQAAGATHVTALNSGMAAISSALITCAGAGANIVASPHLFGNTYVLLKTTLANLGIETRFCNLSDPDQARAAIDSRTCALFLETISNPQMEVADLRALSAVCREANIPLIADTTIVPFPIFRASDFGIDIELVSSTKYISGGATGLGGLIIDYATFDWRSNPILKNWGDTPRDAFNTRLRREVHRNLGAYMTPQTASAQILGLETLNLRFQRQAATALDLARQLQSLPRITSVNYPGLEGNPCYDISRAQFGPLPGAMLTFDMSSRTECFNLINRLKLIRRATNLFDNRSLIIHPASTIYGSFTEEMRRSMDVRQETIRLSVGLENTADLLADISQAIS